MFHAGASLVFVLYMYGCWALGGWPWALPLFSGFAVFLVSWYALRLDGEAPARIGVRAAERAVIPVFAVLLLANTLHAHREFHGPFLAANATLLALALSRRLARRAGEAARWPALLAGAVVSAAAIGLPSWIVQGGVRPGAPLALLAVTIAVQGTGIVLDRRRTDPEPRWPWSRVVVCVVAAALVWGGQAAGIIPPWNPHQRW
jgi:hypothetical protein